MGCCAVQCMEEGERGLRLKGTITNHTSLKWKKPHVLRALGAVRLYCTPCQHARRYPGLAQNVI